MPAETPRSTLIADKARTFRSLAEDSQGPTLDYVVLAAAYEALAAPAQPRDAAIAPKMLNDAAA